MTRTLLGRIHRTVVGHSRLIRSSLVLDQINIAVPQADRAGLCQHRSEGGHQTSALPSKTRTGTLDLILDRKGGEDRRRTRASLIASRSPLGRTKV